MPRGPEGARAERAQEEADKAYALSLAQEWTEQDHTSPSKGEAKVRSGDNKRSSEYVSGKAKAPRDRTPDRGETSAAAFASPDSTGSTRSRGHRLDSPEGHLMKRMRRY